MPSTVVHLALAGLVAVALLGEEFDWRAVAVVGAAIVFVDLDVFVGWWITGAHRAAFHTVLLPLALGVVLLWETRVREYSLVRERVGSRGVAVGWATVAAVLFAGIGPDLFSNGVNVFYPLHDQFYKLNGEVLLSTKDGFVQTFVDLSPPEPSGGQSGGGGQSKALGSTKEQQYYTGVDPNPSQSGAEAADVERTFPIVQSGSQALLVVTSTVVVAARLVRNRLY